MLFDKSTTLNIRHKTFRSKHSCHCFEGWHLLRSRDDLIEGNITIADFLQNGIVANKVSTCGFTLLMKLIASKHTNFDSLASASREQASATDVLITLCWVDVQLDNDFEGLCEFSLLRNFLCSCEDLR